MPSKIGPKKPFRHFIAEHRAKAKLTQKQLAERLETTEMTISRWENYETRVDMPILSAVAEALYGDMAEGEDILHHPDEPSANQMLRQLPEDEQKHIMTQIRRALRAS
jgi:transcriptional regulator with XRE-family HTH domain